MAHDGLMRALGWASAGLGIPQVLAPRQFGQAIGVGDGSRQRAAVLTVGLRELTAAAGLLGQGSPAWLWARRSATMTGEAGGVRWPPRPGWPASPSWTPTPRRPGPEAGPRWT